MRVYAALCDTKGDVIKLLRSIPGNPENESRNVRLLFCEPDQMTAFFNESSLRSVSGSFKLADKMRSTVSVAARTKGERMLFLMGSIDNPNDLSHLLEIYLSMTDELELIQREVFENNHYNIQKVNHLISFQRDQLTNLYTQDAFFERAKAMLKEKPETAFDIAVINIERFKMVNDEFGTAEGDKLLIGLAGCLLSAWKDEDSLLARARADTFYALIPRSRERYETLDRYINQLIEEYSLPMQLQIKVGIYQVENRETEIIQMCDRALMAINNVKGLFDRRFAVYDESLREKMVSEQRIIDAMTEALKQEDFLVYLQPKANIHTGEFVGAEALVRWRHPELGTITPAHFMPTFEKNGFIYSVDKQIWKRACKIIRDWKAAGLECVPVSVNVSRMDIYHDDLPNVLAGLVEHYQLKPEELHLEITESAYMSDSSQLLLITNQLKRLGFVIEMDDFGKGYSSLTALSELPIDVLKMDMGFLQYGTSANRRKYVMQFVIDLANQLNIQVIAEGVETEAQMELLKSMGCLYAQGYYYGKPMPEETFRRYLRHKERPQYSRQ